mmetsp:Transcript_6886/g.15999  ORF Transcript_6886/g.15999 Transcript_6886/m.15999 type:complete len:477 (-) Transcript_6886:1855-3285(-)
MWRSALASLLAASPLVMGGRDRPVGRYAHCAFTYGSSMIIYGGRGYQYDVRRLSPLSDVWALSFDQTSWSELISADASQGTLEGPGDRSSHSCVLMHDDSVLIYGGIVGGQGSSTQRVVSDVWRMVITGDGQDGGANLEARWQMVYVRGMKPSSRFDHAAVRYGQSMLVYGGCVGSDAYDDVWLLQQESSPNDAFESVQYVWKRLQPAPSTGSPITLPPPEIDGNTSFASPPPPWYDASSGIDRSDPGARCAHVAVAHPLGMLIFGGRVPLSTTLRRREVSWLSLSDTWLYEPAAALSGNANPWRLIAQSQFNQGGPGTGGVLLNRSDHAGVLRTDEELLVFGGLYTDVSDDTIYIMKDFLKIGIPELPPTSTEKVFATATRLEWGPAWRFDHSLVIAPRLAVKDSPELLNAPVLFGGGSGMDIFDDVWTYDTSSSKWVNVVPSEPTSAAATFISSLLFGTVGFVLYTCAAYVPHT